MLTKLLALLGTSSEILTLAVVVACLTRSGYAIAFFSVYSGMSPVSIVFGSPIYLLLPLVFDVLLFLRSWPSEKLEVELES